MTEGPQMNTNRHEWFYHKIKGMNSRECTGEAIHG